MAANDRNEIDRRNAWNELDEYVNKESKQGGILVNIQDISLRAQVNDIKTWRNGKKDEYCEKLKFLRSYVDKTREQNRITALDKLTILIIENMKPGGMLNDPKLEPKMKTLLSWKNATAEEYNSEIVRWTNYIKNEKERRAAKKLVHDLIDLETRHGGMLTGYNDKTELTTAKNCNNATTDYYTFELKKWTERVDKERMRCQVRTNLHVFINAGRKAGGLLDRQDWKETMDKLMKWHNGTIEEYTAELDTWKVNAGKESARRLEMRKLHNFIADQMKPGCMLDEETLTVELNSVKSSKYLTIQECTEKLVYWQKYADGVYEYRRESARKNLFDFIVENLVPDGFIYTQKLVDEMNDILTWNDKTLEKYNATLERVDKLASDERRRHKVWKKLNDYIHDNRPILEELNLIGAYHNIDIPKDQTTEVYEQEQQRLNHSVELEYARRKAAVDLIKFVRDHSHPDDSPYGEKFRKEMVEMVLWAKEHRTIEDYKAKQENWAKRVDTEIERRSELKKMQNFIAHNSKAGGVLNASKFTDEFRKLAKLLEETTEFYKNKISEWKIILQEETHRQLARKKLYDLLDDHNDMGGILTDSRFQKKILQIRELTEESAERYESQRQKWSEIIESEQKLRDEAHRKLLDFYGREMRPGGSLEDSDVQRKLKFTTADIKVSKQECMAELNYWTSFAKDHKVALSVDAENKLQSFIDDIHPTCMDWKQKQQIDKLRKYLTENPDKDESFYTGKLEVLKTQYERCIIQPVFSANNVSKWQQQIDSLNGRFKKNPKLENYCGILIETSSFFAFQVAYCKIKRYEISEANRNVNDILYYAEELCNSRWKPTSWTKDSMVRRLDSLKELINSVNTR